MKCQIQLFLIFLSSISTASKVDLVCAEYSQGFASKDTTGIDASKNPLYVVYSSECKGCVATTKNGNFKASCVQKDSDFGSKLCGTQKILNCEDQTCCCLGDFCYDQLRNYFASTPAKESTKCFVQRKNSTQSGANDSSFWRSTCSICVAEFRGDAIESRCVESGSMTTECSTATELPGENLACTKNLKKCCCKSDKCQEQFEKLFFKTGDLGKSLLSGPYGAEPKMEKLKSDAPATRKLLYNFNGCLLFLCFAVLFLP